MAVSLLPQKGLQQNLKKDVHCTKTVKSEGLAGVTVKITAYWNVALCSLADR
jgi:hypothetical protein